MLLAKYTIPLEPYTKKNSHRIAGRGERCPYCGKFHYQFIRNGNDTLKYAVDASKFLFPKPTVPIESQVTLVYKIYTKTHRVVDDLNLYEALDDILVKFDILKDDNRKIIRSRDGSRVLYDKDNPRSEIYIYDYNGEEDKNG